jgi:hypothetical protein
MSGRSSGSASDKSKAMPATKAKVEKDDAVTARRVSNAADSSDVVIDVKAGSGWETEMTKRIVKKGASTSSDDVNQFALDLVECESAFEGSMRKPMLYVGYVLFLANIVVAICLPIIARLDYNTQADQKELVIIIVRFGMYATYLMVPILFFGLKAMKVRVVGVDNYRWGDNADSKMLWDMQRPLWLVIAFATGMGSMLFFFLFAFTDVAVTFPGFIRFRDHFAILGIFYMPLTVFSMLWIWTMHTRIVLATKHILKSLSVRKTLKDCHAIHRAVQACQESVENATKPFVTAYCAGLFILVLMCGMMAFTYRWANIVIFGLAGTCCYYMLSQFANVNGMDSAFIDDITVFFRHGYHHVTSKQTPVEEANRRISKLPPLARMATKGDIPRAGLDNDGEIDLVDAGEAQAFHRVYGAVKLMQMHPLQYDVFGVAITHRFMKNYLIALIGITSASLQSAFWSVVNSGYL